MTPYYEHGGITIYHGNCLDVLAWRDADVLITDPPYGIVGGRISGHGRGGPSFQDAKWDDLSVRDLALELWGDRPRAVFGSPRRLDAAIAHVEAPLIWDKGDSPGMGRLDWPFGVSYELIYINGDGWSAARSGSVFRYQHNSSAASKAGHPTPKPVALMSRLVGASRGVVADPFAGSGSTLVAARMLSRNAIGIEIEERYCEIAAKRLSQEILSFGGEDVA